MIIENEMTSLWKDFIIFFCFGILLFIIKLIQSANFESIFATVSMPFFISIIIFVRGMFEIKSIEITENFIIFHRRYMKDLKLKTHDKVLAVLVKARINLSFYYRESKQKDRFLGWMQANSNDGKKFKHKLEQYINLDYREVAWYDYISNW